MTNPWKQDCRQRLRSSKRYEAWRNTLVALMLVTAVWGISDLGSGGDSFALTRTIIFAAGIVAAAWLLGARTAHMKAENATRIRMEERLRLSRDVHDALSHSLGSIGVRAGVSAHVDSLSEEELRTALTEIEVEARAGIEELRQLLDRERGFTASAALKSRRDPATDDWSLRAELEETLAVARKTGMQTTLTFDPQVESLPSTHRTTLFRATRELVTNVIRHASATCVAIAVWRVGYKVVVKVEDNGMGRVTAIAEGHGLTGVRERLALLGGQLDIADRRPQGLAVTVAIPFPPNLRATDD